MQDYEEMFFNLSHCGKDVHLLH